jgi:hypothetical protein
LKHHFHGGARIAIDDLPPATATRINEPSGEK